jgi:hypothetical protein
MAQRYTEISYEKMILQKTKSNYPGASGLIEAVVIQKRKARTRITKIAQSRRFGISLLNLHFIFLQVGKEITDHPNYG